MKRTAVISETLGPPLNEGIRKFATSLIDGFEPYSETIGIATESEAIGDQIRQADAGKLFRGSDMRKQLKLFAPDLIVYVPSASGTFPSFMRARSLKKAYPRAHVSMVLPQMRKHTAFTQLALGRFVPDSIFCQSMANVRYLKSIGISAGFLPSGVDVERFHPVSLKERDRLRDKFRLPSFHYLVLHAGHLSEERNTDILAKLEGVGRGVMLAGAAGRDPYLKPQLEAQGVIVLDKYIDKVEELYQAVDCYVFPTQKSDAAMDFPLSVLEAMACDLPVVTTPYGGLPEVLEARDGLWFAKKDDEILDAIREAKDARINTRAQAIPLDWPNIAAMILEAAEVRNAGAIVSSV